MRKRINLRFALYLMLTVAALATGTHFLHGYQVRRNAGTLKERARQYQEQGDLSKAAEYFGQYLGLNPADFDALAQYGLVLADDKLAKTPQNRARALATLERALVRNPGRQDVRRRAVQVAMSLGRYPAARHNLEGLPKDPEVVLMLAKCHEALNDLKEARKTYQDAVKLAPNDLDAHARLATLLRRKTTDVLNVKEKETTTDAWNKADKFIDAMVEANKGSYRAYLLRAEYLRTFPPLPEPDVDKAKAERLDKIKTDLGQARRLAPDSADVLLAAADWAVAQKESGEARDLLEECRKLHPKDWRVYQALARLEIKERKTDEAVAWLDKAIAEVPDRADLHWDRAKLLAAAGRGADAETSLVTLRKSGFPDADLDVLQGQILMLDGQWEKAIKQLEQGYDPLVNRADRLKDPTAAAWAEQAGLWLGECYERTGDTSRAHTAYSRVVARDNQSVPGRIGVANALWAQGRLQDALDQYRVIVRLPGRPDGCLAEFARLLMLINLEREESRRDWQEVDYALRQAEQLQPLPTAVAILRADLLANQRKFDQARESLLNRYPDGAKRPAEIWGALATLEEMQERPNVALDLLSDARRLIGDSVDLRLTRAGYFVRKGQGQAREELLALADGADQFPVVDRRRLFRGLAAAFAQAKLTAEATALWQRLALEMPDDFQSRIALFHLAVAADDTDAMDRWQKEIRKKEGEDGVMWRFARTTALLKKRDNPSLVEARSLLTAMTARRPDWPKVPLTAARIFEAENRPDDALPLYLRAIQLGERDPAAIAQTFNLLVERGRIGEANRVARLLSNSSASALDAQRAIGEVALRANDLSRAKNVADAVVKAADKDYRGYLLRGQTHWATGNPADAEKDFRKAQELAPNEPTTWLTLVDFLIASKRKGEAGDLVDKARGLLTGPKGLSALARIHSRLGEADKAAKLHAAAVAAAGNDADVLGNAALYYLSSGRQQEGDKLLRRLRDGSDRKWAAQARYLLAASMASRGTPDALEKALAEIDDPGADLSAAEKVQQQRARAQVYALQPTRSLRREAIRILEGLIDRQLATPADQLLTAQLYEAIGDVGKARPRYTALLTLPGDNPSILAEAGRFLVRHADLDGAALALRALETHHPQMVAAKFLRARLLHAQNQTAKAFALLRECAEKDGANRKALAGVLEELGQYAEAEAQLRASKRPEDILSLVEYLVRRKRYVDALDVCEGAWENSPPVAVAEACLTVLAEMPASTAAAGRVAARVQAALEKSPDDLGLLAALAAVRNFEGQFDDAEKLYRRILKKDSGHVAALNNLAWLLALRGGRAGEAVQLVNHAVQINGPNPNLLDTRAVAYLALNRAEDAVNDLREVVAESPSPTAYFHLAQAQLSAGRQKEAVLAWKQANEGTRLNPDTLHPLERPAHDRLVEVLRPST